MVVALTALYFVSHIAFDLTAAAFSGAGIKALVMLWRGELTGKVKAE
jgi:hypothetical protein